MNARTGIGDPANNGFQFVNIQIRRVDDGVGSQA